MNEHLTAIMHQMQTMRRNPAAASAVAKPPHQPRRDEFDYGTDREWVIREVAKAERASK